MIATRFKQSVKLLFIATSVASLSACAVFKNQESCNRIGGINGCVSMDEVYSMSENGQISSTRSPYSVDGEQFNVSTAGKGVPVGQTSSQMNTSPQSQNSNPSSQISTSGYNVATPNIGQPVRYGERIQKMWIYPYEDSKGNYHEASILYAVIKNPHWVGYPEVAVVDDEYGFNEE